MTTRSDLFEISEVVSRDRLSAALLPVDRPFADEADLADALEDQSGELAGSLRFKLGHANLEAPPPWAIGFSKQFKKDTHALDRKLMGRILAVLEELSDYAPPFKAQGDTFKPLNGDLEGCWRYRIGDSRLVIKPVTKLARLDALTFAARGSVYD